MVNHTNPSRFNQQQIPQDDGQNRFDYNWFDTQFENLLERLSALENSVNTIGQSAVAGETQTTQSGAREYFSVVEFAQLVERGEYTVREWCRLARIHAEKCDSGRGEAKSWKIPVEELQRYRDHGLLSMKYFR